MADGARCTCAYCRICGLMWPAMLITTGVLFLIGEYTRYSFRELRPVLFIVAGLLKVGQAMVSKEGHVGS